MTTFKTILVLVDPALRVTPALERSAELAERTGAALQLCLLDHDPHEDRPKDSIARGAHDTFLRMRSAWLGQQVNVLKARGLHAQGEFVSTLDVARGVLAKVIQHRPSLVVRDLHPLSEFEWLEFRPDEREILEYCPAPLLMVRPGSKGLPRTILAAAAGAGDPVAGAVSEAVAEVAHAAGVATGAAAHITHVYPHHPLSGEGHAILAEGETERRKAEREDFDQFAQRFGYAEGCRHWVEGSPLDTLIAFVKEYQADWLVIGSVYHSLLAQMRIELLGSKTEHLVGKTPCDVLFVKPSGFIAELARHVNLDEVCHRHGVALRRAA